MVVSSPALPLGSLPLSQTSAMMETCAPGDRGRDGLGTAEGPYRRKQRNSRMCVAPHLRRSAAADANETTHVRFVGTDGLSEGLWARNVLADRDRQDHELSGHLLPKGRAGNNACRAIPEGSTTSDQRPTRGTTPDSATWPIHVAIGVRRGAHRPAAVFRYSEYCY